MAEGGIGTYEENLDKFGGLFLHDSEFYKSFGHYHAKLKKVERKKNPKIEDFIDVINEKLIGKENQPFLLYDSTKEAFRLYYIRNARKVRKEDRKKNQDDLLLKDEFNPDQKMYNYMLTSPMLITREEENDNKKTYLVIMKTSTTVPTQAFHLRQDSNYTDGLVLLGKIANTYYVKDSKTIIGEKVFRAKLHHHHLLDQYKMNMTEFKHDVVFQHCVDSALIVQIDLKNKKIINPDNSLIITNKSNNLQEIDVLLDSLLQHEKEKYKILEDKLKTDNNDAILTKIKNENNPEINTETKCEYKSNDIESQLAHDNDFKLPVNTNLELTNKDKSTKKKNIVIVSKDDNLLDIIDNHFKGINDLRGRKPWSKDEMRTYDYGSPDHHNAVSSASFKRAKYKGFKEIERRNIKFKEQQKLLYEEKLLSEEQHEKQEEQQSHSKTNNKYNKKTNKKQDYTSHKKRRGKR